MVGADGAAGKQFRSGELASDRTWRGNRHSSRLLTVLLLDGQSEDVGPLGNLWTMAVDSRGRYGVTCSAATLPQVFTDEGVLVANIGSRGQGPGEFVAPLAGVPVGDSMAVFDQNHRMIMVGLDLRAHRTFRIEGEVLLGAPLPWPRVVVNARISTPDAAGFPSHILNLEAGAVERSFGARSDEDFSPQDRQRLSGVVATDLGRGPLDRLPSSGRHLEAGMAPWCTRWPPCSRRRVS